MIIFFAYLTCDINIQAVSAQQHKQLNQEYSESESVESKRNKEQAQHSPNSTHHKAPIKSQKVACRRP